MKITNPLIYIHTGGRIRYLAGRVIGDTIIGKNLIYDNLLWLKRDIENLGFRVSLNLYKMKLGKLENSFKELSEIEELSEKDNKLDGETNTKLIESILDLESTLLCEAKEHVIASPIPRRFILDHLLSQPGNILGKGVFDNLTQVAKHDLSYACKCIAFECSTAAAFHVLRCVEECVRVLHNAYFPRKDSSKAWGPLIKELSEKPKNPKPDETLIEHLNHLRKRFRNPTDHPEKIYEIEEAEDIVHMAVDVINRVSRDPKVKA